MINNYGKQMEDLKDKTFGEMDDPAQAFRVIFNGYKIGEIKSGIDSLVEFGRLVYFIKKYKYAFIIPLALFALWFFKLDLQTVIRIIK